MNGAFLVCVCVRVRGIEPPTQRWKRRILPLNYTREMKMGHK